MYLNTIKKTIPALKYCYGKNKLVNIESCDCINKCMMEYVIPHHKTTPMKFYTQIKCELTNFNQKVGDCSCIDNCSAKQNDLELLYELESLNVPNTKR